MQPPTFITGNQSKADNLAKLIGIPIEHHKLDLDEIQSLDLRAVIEHKVRQAYDILKKPVIVEDVALEFVALGRLPGTFIKFFINELSLEKVCRLLDAYADRGATARCMYGYHDGEDIHVVEGSLSGTIAQSPAGNHGFGWDAIFIPDGYTQTRAELDSATYETVYLAIKPIKQLKALIEKQSHH